MFLAMATCAQPFEIALIHTALRPMLHVMALQGPELPAPGALPALCLKHPLALGLVEILHQQAQSDLDPFSTSHSPHERIAIVGQGVSASIVRPGLDSEASHIFGPLESHQLRARTASANVADHSVEHSSMSRSKIKPGTSVLQ